LANSGEVKQQPQSQKQRSGARLESAGSDARTASITMWVRKSHREIQEVKWQRRGRCFGFALFLALLLSGIGVVSKWMGWIDGRSGTHFPPIPFLDAVQYFPGLFVVFFLSLTPC
jgi:hypothetical protein